MTTNNAVNTTLSGQTGTGNFVGSNTPTIATPIIAQVNDTNGNSILQFSPVASAVNSFQIFNNQAGSPPIIFVSGTDTNIGVTIEAKGTGLFRFQSTSASNQVQWTFTGTNSNVFDFPTNTGTNTYTWPASSGTVGLTSTGTWIPIDASGASLTFTTATGTYIQIGNMVIATGYVVYPSTVNSSAAIIGGLPVTTGTTNQKMGGHVSQTSVATLAHALTLTSNTTFGLYTTAGAGVLNSAMSLSTSTFQLIYFI